MLKPATLALALLTLAPLHAQSPTAADIQSGQTAKRPGETGEQHGRRLLDEMLAALGGQAWLDKKTSTTEGQTAAFFRGEPTGSVVRYVEYKQFAQGTIPEQSRVEYLTVRGMIMPGMKKDVVHLWTADNGYELTYKGRTTLPADQVADYLRRRAHSIDEVMRTWVKAPGVAIVYEGQGMRDRRPIDRVGILSAGNDAVTLELDQQTHLPLQRSFEWRNEQFKDRDLDEEVYGDWRLYDGIATPMNVTRYRNGDMNAQIFFTKVTFNQAFGLETFDKERYPKKK